MDSITVRFLGCGDAVGSGGRFQTCLLVEGTTSRTLIDCGASSLVAMKRVGVEPRDISLVLVSHLHGDHFGGLPFLVLDGQFSKRDRPLIIAGPPGIETRTREAMEVFFPGSSSTKQRFQVTFVELQARRSMAFGPVRVTPFTVVHASGAPPYALRVELESRTIAYSGDTEWTDTLVDVSEKADLFICEAYFFDKRIPFHLDYQSLWTRRALLTCRRIVLTHMSAEMMSRPPLAGVEYAYDGLALDL